MGLRNPFRFAVNRRTTTLRRRLLAGRRQRRTRMRGPAGTAGGCVIDKPATTAGRTARRRRLAVHRLRLRHRRRPAPTFNCNAPVNDSPHNTGLRELPPVEQPDVWYSYGRVGRSSRELGHAAASARWAARRTTSTRSSSRRTVAGLLRRRAAVLRVDARLHQGVPPQRRRRRSTTIRPVVPSSSSTTRWTWSSARTARSTCSSTATATSPRTPDAQLARIDFVPAATARRSRRSAATPTAGQAAADGRVLQRGHDRPGRRHAQRTRGTSTPTAGRQHRAERDANLHPERLVHATLKVTDPTGRSASAPRAAPGRRPRRSSSSSPRRPGQPFHFGDTVTYEVTVTDDQPVDCSQVRSPTSSATTSTGTRCPPRRAAPGPFTTSCDGGTAGADNLTAVFVAEYTDSPTDPGVPAQSGSATVVLDPTPVAGLAG